MLFFSGLVCFYADPLHNQPSLESALMHVLVLATIHATDAVLTILLSYIKRDGSAHIHIYCIYNVQTLAQNWTAISGFI